MDDLLFPLAVLGATILLAVGVFARFTPARLSLDAEVAAYRAHRSMAGAKDREDA